MDASGDASLQGILNDTDRTIQLLKQVKLMCSESVGCKNIGSDQDMLGLLILALTSSESNIVQVALEALYKIARFDENRRQIFCVDKKYDHGLFITLRKLMAQSTMVVQELSRNVYDILENPSGHLGHKKLDFKDRKKNMSCTPKKRRNSFFLAGGVGNTKVIVLQIRGMRDKDDKELVRERILTVKGVVSFTIDERKSRVTLRTVPDLNPECLADAIRDTMTMVAEQVIKSESGEEVLISFKSRDTSLENLPDYPSDEESPVKGEKEVDVLGNDTEKANSWGFVNSVTNFLQNSLYW